MALPIPTHRVLTPALDAPGDTAFSFGGWVGDRIRANEQNWLIPAPSANPGMISMFAHRQDMHSVNGPGDNRDPVPWAGEFAGKYLISAVQSLRLTQNPALEGVVRPFVTQLIQTQGRDGSLGLPLPWDLWGQYHVMLGLLRWYEHTGDTSALAACQRAADLACARYLGRVSAIESDHPNDGEKNQAVAHVLALLYEYTGQASYLDLVHQIETAWTLAPFFNFIENALAGRDFFAGARPRWESLHDIQAVAELYFITGQPRYRQAYEQIWRNIRALDRHSTGGFTSGEAATGNAYDPRYIETCGGVAWMALTVDMLRMTADPAAVDELELSLLNAILGAQSQDGRLWTYHTPMGGIPVGGITPADRIGYRLPAYYDLAWQARELIPQLSCCAANGPRGIGCLSEWAVMQASDAVVINHYGALTARVQRPGGAAVSVVQESGYPFDNAVKITVHPDATALFTIRLRIPAWSRATQLLVNGTAQQCTAGSYCSLNRTWVAGDIIQLTLDMSVRLVPGARNAAGLTASYRGPLLLALDSAGARFDPSRPPTFNLASPPKVDEVGGGVRVTIASSAGPVTLVPFAVAGSSSGGNLTGRPDPTGTWEFARSNGTVLAEQIGLLGNGKLSGYSHPNEASWGYQDDVLTFFSSQGIASTRFVIRMEQRGKQVLSGRSLLDPSIRHILSQVDTAIAGKTWQFVRRVGDNETVLLPMVRLLAGGGFDVATNPNEHHWGLENGALVFYAANGAPSTRFTSIQMQNGLVKRQGNFLFDHSMTHELVEVDLDLTSLTWRFMRTRDGLNHDILADKVRLLPRGEIDGYWHPNEARWEYEAPAGTLNFRAANNAVSTPFDTLRASNGAMRFEGTFAFDHSLRHVLEESAPGWKMDETYVSWVPFQGT